MIAIETLERFSPWWRTGKVRPELLQLFYRNLYEKLVQALERRQIIQIWGLRRVGKTTLLFQLIDHLLKKIPPQHILYFSFDEISISPVDVLEGYQAYVLHQSFESSKGPIYIFFDEIQKAERWDEILKTYYDLYPHIHFIISGSASVMLRKQSSESFAGRIDSYLLTPLLFSEFLSLNEINVEAVRSDPALWKREILPLFFRYIKFGTFPELARETNEEFARRYIRSLVERIVYGDIPQAFEIRDIELLRKLLEIVCCNPGMILNYVNIAHDLGRDRRTVANYLEYLECALIIKFYYNYRTGSLRSLRKLKKIYQTTPNITFAYRDEFEHVLPFMLENIVATSIGAEFYYRDGGEIDFVIPGPGGITAIEIKTTAKNIGRVKRFLKTMEGKIVNVHILDAEYEGEKDGLNIIPIWRFLLEYHMS